ncbi:unnamed protein product [Rotaria sordida]|uniref:Uncharacterized protein n=1 Tax=Rotaria sordida TaxID=392033 RepID=A0A814SB17_9BILA|nr:unnamed protein product [Rotaria sordida]CAF1142673.1 unnamed protein product [Rotaria sordida]
MYLFVTEIYLSFAYKKCLSKQTQPLLQYRLEKTKKKTICGAYTSELEYDHCGIQDVQGHYFCTQCSTNIVRLFFSELQNYIPLRCLICHIELNPSVFERQLTPEQIEFYDQHMLIFVWSKDFLHKDERLDHCPFCSFAAIRNINASHIFHCQHEQCLKVSCLICRKVCPKFQSDYGTDEELTEMDKHFKCAELANDKHIVDQYLESGQKVACPKCGLAGMKDDACTHMACPTCVQLWYYFFVEKKLKIVKKHERELMVYLIIIIIEIVILMSHRNRSLRLLREICEKLGKERIDELDRHFNIISTSGFTMKEILDEDLTLIKYPDNVGTRHND